MSTSDCWAVLGIEPTEDISQIKGAYHRVLPNYHPEDDPD